MQKFRPCKPAPGSVERTRRDFLDRYDNDPEFSKQFEGDRETFITQLDEMIERANGEQYSNDIYHVVVMPIADDWVHVSVKRHDRKPIFHWRDMQTIKNELVGERTEGAQLLPSVDREVDAANQYHFWCCTDENFRFPFGFTQRLILENPPGKARNKRFAKD
jgi:hypothetical protein